MPLSIYDMKPESVWGMCVCVFRMHVCRGCEVCTPVYLGDCAGEGGGKGEKRKC